LAVKGSLAKIAFFLKDEFNYFAPKYIEMLMKDANLKINFTAGDAVLPASEQKGTTAIDFKVRGMEDMARFYVNTSEAEQKLAAFDHIKNVACAMGTAFEPHVATVLPVLLSHMND